MKYNWKEEYYDQFGIGVNATKKIVKYFTPFTDGDGSRENPGSTNDIQGEVDQVHIIGGNYINLTFKEAYPNTTQYIQGHGTMKDTTVDVLHILSQNIIHNYYKDLKINSFQITRINNPSASINFYKCDLNTIAGVYIPPLFIKNCIVRSNISARNDTQNSFINLNDKSLTSSPLSLFEKCNLIVTKDNITQLQHTYFAFDDCNFRIGNEAEYLPLNGNNEDELRADFVSRCLAQGISCPVGKEAGENELAMYRWIFAKNSSIEGVILSNSIIHNFEKRRFIYFGYTSLREGFSVSVTNKKNSFSSISPNVNFEFENNNMSLPASFNISAQGKAEATSNIMWLGDKQAIKRMELNHNFPKEYGINIDSTPTLGQSVEKITMGENNTPKYYLVRSNNEEEAIVTYNGETYSSALFKRNNIIKSVENITELKKSNGVVFEILDLIQYQTIRMRIVNKIPDAKIDLNNLTTNYWYYVEHDTDQTNTTDYILYKEKKYYTGDSFLVSGALTCTKYGNIHLRRCWNESFDYNTENIDKAFWTNEQKPEWTDIVPDDPRCLMKNNNPKEIEMQKGSDGSYIASGHPDFYNKLMGIAGPNIPAYPIQGAYIQLKVILTTLNPM